jgi:DNA/RNA endonuclease G (NUC1)
MRKFLNGLAIAIAFAVALTQFGGQLEAVSGTIVLSQVYGGGGNVGATFKNDFIELFNRGNSPVNLSGWSVQYASAAGTSWSVTNLTNVTLAPGQYYLVQEALGTGGTQNLPTPDASGTIAMSATAGKVALVSTTTALSGACPAGVVDLIGFNSTGASGCSEGTPTTALTNTTAAIRALGGCTDTDVNVSDFAIGAPTPRNTASPLAPCGGGDAAPFVSSTTPASGAANVPFGSNIVINFSESVTASASAFSLECPAGSPQAFTQNPSSPATTFTLTPSAPLPAATSCAVKVAANQVSDADTNDPPDHMASDFSVSFTTVNPVDAAPSVVSVTPANGAPNVPVASPIVVNFSESVSASSIAFSVQCPVGVQQGFVQSAGPATTFTLTHSLALPYSTSCTVTVAADQISDTDTNDPPDHMASEVAFSFTTAAAPPPGAGKVMINEIDADTPDSDTAEFIELYDGGSGLTTLDGLVVVLYDGGLTPFTGNQSYAAFDLTGKSTDANGYFVLGNPGVPNAGLTFDPGQFGLLQNGPDAVALYVGHASDFPNGTVVTTNNLLDAVVYGTDDPAPQNLMSLINSGQKIVNEDATGNGTTQSSQRCPSGMGGFRNTSPYYPGTPTPGTANNCPAARPASDVVISQIYGGGGNSGATYRNDFVELYNRGAATVNLSGWSLQYSPAASNGLPFLVQPIGGSIGAGKYYLIELASGGANGSVLPVDANIVGNINMAAGSGKVALVNRFDALLGGCPIYDPRIMDFVGYGTADCSEGPATAAALSNSTADVRKGAGAQDTDVNGNDFVAPPITPFPHRTEPIVELGPFVFKTDPSRDGTDAPRDATIDVTFTEAVTVDPAWFSILCAASGPHNSATFASDFGGQDQYITPNDNFIAGEQCTVTIFKDRVHDVDLNDDGPNTDTLPDNYSWSFTVASGTAPPYPPSVHLTMGNPTAAGTDPLNFLMEKPEYALSYNRDLGRPNWVSWHLSDEWTGSLVRADTFRPDPQVPPDWYRVQSFDFSGTGFDRGHMTPNADRDKETSIPINQATFLMSNMVAQAPGNNQGPWAAFEAYLRTLTDPANLVDGNHELYIVAGPAGMGGTGTNGGVTNTVADGHVTVPNSTWKVALVLPKAAGDDLSRVDCSTRTIAVIMPNLDSIRSDPWQNYLTTVDAVEALSGYNLFSNLPEPYQRCIEAGTNGSNLPLVPGDQTITFAQPADRIYGDAPFTVSASGGASGNPVTFAASGACSSSGPDGATITILTPGACTVTASQAGSVIYNAAPDAVRSFQVVDRTAPAIASVTPSVTSLWPPNKKMVPVSFAVSVTDDVDPAPACQAVAVSSNEGGASDWQITGPSSVSLRADRAGNGNGRRYVISVRCTDASGNASTATATVSVPHDQGK